MILKPTYTPFSEIQEGKFIGISFFGIVILGLSLGDLDHYGLVILGVFVGVVYWSKIDWDRFQQYRACYYNRLDRRER